ncbi:MAG: type II secretion system F family protein [Clostridia bacterium]|nr:type II secretion system F family protein [Clostridia bacterium]
MKYKYTAMNARNQKKEGALEAETQSQAIAILREKGLIVQDISEAAGSKEATSIMQMEIGGDIHTKKIKKKRLLQLFNQIGMMMKAGINLSLSMQIMIDSEKELTMKKILREINEGLYNGLTLSQAMRNFEAFPSIYISIVEAGEANGRLDMAFEQSAVICKKDIALSGKIKSAMMYPVFLIVLVIALIVILTVFVLPQFKETYGSMGAELPGLTLGVMAFSDFLINYWWLVLILTAGIIFAFITLKRTSAEFSMMLAKLIMKIPLVGPIIRQSSLARFCRLMSTLTDSGIPIHKAMALSRDAVPNLFVRARIADVLSDVQIGITIHEAMAKHPVFDPILVSMVRVGEESGMLGDSFYKMAEMFESQTDESTERLTEAMTPVMTVVIGVVVGIVVVAMILPMFGVYSVIDANT